jgi:hypothetical protein
MGLLLLLLLTAIELSFGGSSPYTSTDKTNKNINETIQKTVQTIQNTVSTHLLPKHPHIHTPTHYKTS